MTLSETIVLGLFVLACAAAASPGIFFRPGQWYEQINKPDWRPPNWLFGPVWLVLYISIAVSGWLIWRQSGNTNTEFPLILFVAPLVLNGLWSTVFFGMRRPGLAFCEIIALWVSIIAVIIAFHPISQIASWMLIPYWLWVSFAVVLNYSIWRRNRAD